MPYQFKFMRLHVPTMTYTQDTWEAEAYAYGSEREARLQFLETVSDWNRIGNDELLKVIQDLVKRLELWPGHANPEYFPELKEARALLARYGHE